MSSPSSLPFATEYHTPIMVEEIMEGLNIQPGSTYVDGTIGGGGHTQAILEAGGKVIGLDQDQQALEYTNQRHQAYLKSGQLHLIHANFDQMLSLVKQVTDQPIMGVLLDLGVSSHQLDDTSRGFRFDSDQLDMRMDQRLAVTATDLLAKVSVKGLTEVLSAFGEERYAKRFAQAIVDQRQHQPITSAKQLSQIIYQASPYAYRRGPIHPATRTFQALRLAVNSELDSLQLALPAALELLAPQGRLAVLSFHSLEDRLVKHFITDQSSLKSLHSKPLQATAAEISVNPRARSAKLRLAIKQEAI